MTEVVAAAIAAASAAAAAVDACNFELLLLSFVAVVVLVDDEDLRPSSSVVIFCFFEGGGKDEDDDPFSFNILSRMIVQLRQRPIDRSIDRYCVPFLTLLQSKRNGTLATITHSFFFRRNTLTKVRKGNRFKQL